MFGTRSSWRGSWELARPFGALAGGLFQQLIDRGDEHANESKIIEVSREQTPEGEG